MKKKKTLSAGQLRWRCDPGVFEFKTTDDLPSLSGIIGQDRAVSSIEFGLGIDNHNYNVFVLGESGTGKASTVKEFVEKKAREEVVPGDWCYIYNFSEPDSPRAITLPPGRGAELCSEMHALVETLRRDIPRVFESKDYETHRDEIVNGQQERTKAIFSRLERMAAERGVILKKSVSGLAVTPAKDGKPMSQEAFDSLGGAEKEAVEESLRFMQERLADAVRDAKAIDKETKERINALDREVVQYVINPLVSELLEKFGEFDAVVEFIGLVKEDILENIDDFRPGEEMPISIPGLKMSAPQPSFERYRVNLFVNNRETAGAPVVFEANPTYYNLFGRIEYKVQLGVATTDFTMIKAGAAHRANGGYLIINALDMLRNIFVYDSIKRMIKNREIRMEDVWEQYRLVSSTSLKPEPIPVNIKLVLIGEPFLYYMLYNLDNEYRKLFKVKSDFDNVMPRNEENIYKYALFVATECKAGSLLPFDPTGVAAVVERGARLSGDNTRLTARFNEVKNVVVEASYWAGVDSSTVVTDEHVERAVTEMIYRRSKIEDKLRDYIVDDTIMVDTEGKVVGQVNGIAVLDPGDYAFGKPSRITARTFMGEKGVVNIEREVKMSGRIHNKAVLILTGFLGERFSRKVPLALSASLCFEQLYDEIEGDSATCAEVYALMSSLSGLPIDQGIAVTGSMNQRGEVQPIGGVNQKIEGFFDVCKARGLTGSQGVIIPGRNVRNLMLRKDVIHAVEAGEFSVYPVDTVDEGLEILTATPVGEPGPDGAFPKGTVNRLAADRIEHLAKSLKAFGRAAAKKRQVEAVKKEQDPKKP